MTKTTDPRILTLAETVRTYNNTAVKEVRERSVSFDASPFAYDGPNGIAKHLPAGLRVRVVASYAVEGYRVNTYLATTTCAVQA